MDIQAIIFIGILAFITNTIVQILDKKLIDRSLLEKLKRMQKELKKSGKTVKLEDKLKEINEIYFKIFPKQMLLMTISFAIFAFVLFILNLFYSGKIIIPLPFKVPITNRYGIGALGTYILISIPLSFLTKKLINKLSKK